MPVMTLATPISWTVGMETILLFFASNGGAFVSSAVGDWYPAIAAAAMSTFVLSIRDRAASGEDSTGNTLGGTAVDPHVGTVASEVGNRVCALLAAGDCVDCKPGVGASAERLQDLASSAD